MMRTKILLWGGKPLMYPIQPDKPETLIETLKDALSRADIVVINGGSSEGSDDFTIEALNAVGTVQNHVTYNGPGAHTSCAVSHEGKPIVGIPGPAIGAEYVADWFIKPLIDSFFGLYEPEPSAEAVYHGPDFPERDSLFSMIRRARLERKEDGTFTVEAVEFDDKRGMDLSNAFIAFTPQGVHDGDVVRVSLRYPYRFI